MADVKHFKTWVVLTAEASVDLLVSKLLRKGYVVGPLAKDGSLVIKGELSTLVSLKLSKTPDDQDTRAPQKIAIDDITSILKEADRTYHSIIVVHEGGNSQWQGSNIKLPQELAKTAYERLTDDVEEVPEE